MKKEIDRFRVFDKDRNQYIIVTYQNYIISTGSAIPEKKEMFTTDGIPVNIINFDKGIFETVEQNSVRLFRL